MAKYAASEASMYCVKADQPWFGDIPEDARENTERFLAAAFAKTTGRGIQILLPGIRVKPKDTSACVRRHVSLEEQTQGLRNESSAVRIQAAWDLMVSDHDVPMEILLKGLEDDDGTVRWFLTEALQRKAGQPAALETARELLSDNNEYVRVSATDLIVRACEAEPLSSVELLIDSPIDRRDAAYILHKACAQNVDSIEDILQSLTDYTIRASEVGILVHMFPLAKSLVSVHSTEASFDDASVPAFINRARMKRRKSTANSARPF